MIRQHSPHCHTPCCLLLPMPPTLPATNSVFLFFVMRRLLDIQGQLFAMRALAKQAAALSGGNTGDAQEQQRQLSKTLSQMARSSVDDGEQPSTPGAKRD